MFSYVLVFALCATAASAWRPRLDGRIVNGEDVSIVDFPYQLSLQYNNKHICGASIIGEKWALTAAHCIISSDPKKYNLRAGSSTRYYGGYYHSVVYVLQNIDYDTKTHDMDFALMKIDGSFKIGTPGVNSVPLGHKEPETGTSCIVSGWGLMSSGGIAPENLKAVKVHVTDRNACDRVYVGYGGITSNMFCAADPGKDSCQGDSGGPLVSNGVQVGVVSWGVGCANPKYPGVYSNMPKALDWIRDVTGLRV